MLGSLQNQTGRVINTLHVSATGMLPEVIVWGMEISEGLQILIQNNPETAMAIYQ